MNLEAGSTAYYALRAVDDAGNAGGVSNSVEVSLPEDTVPPGTILNLRVLTLEPYEAILLWKAPGNDGEESRVTGYEIRYSREYLTEETWDTGLLLPEPPAPMEPGQLQRYRAEGLPRGAELWFGVRAKDEAGNRGDISNVMPGQILPRGIWEVREDGTGDAPFIQAAIDSSRDGEVVLVYPGIYYENLNLLGKAIELRSADGPEVTTIDGSQGDTSVILCVSGETNATLIKGFTITGGRGYPITITSRTGGAILCLDSCPTIEGNIIRGNSSIGEIFDSRGGGITNGGSNPCRVYYQK